MIAIASPGAVSVKYLATAGVCDAHCPPQIAPSTSTNRSAVMSEDNPLVCRKKVAAILQALGRSCALPIEHQYFRGDKFAVETIPNCVSADRSRDQPKSIDLLAAV